MIDRIVLFSQQTRATVSNQIKYDNHQAQATPTDQRSSPHTITAASATGRPHSGISNSRNRDWSARRMRWSLLRFEPFGSAEEVEEDMKPRLAALVRACCQAAVLTA